VRFSSLLSVAGAIAFAFGLGFFFAPSWTMNIYGASTGPVGYLMARYFGATLILVGLMYLLMRGVQEPTTARGLALASALGALAGLKVSLFAVRNGMVSALGWSTVAIYGLLFLSFGWFALGRNKTI
jgi:hypothetical protein